MLLVQTITVPAQGIDAFRQFEAAVLPLLAEHGGTLERRLRSIDGATEIHIVSFVSREALDSYRADPRRQERLDLLRDSRATSELVEVVDVTGVE